MISFLTAKLQLSGMHKPRRHTEKHKYSSMHYKEVSVHIHCLATLFLQKETPILLNRRMSGPNTDLHIWRKLSYPCQISTTSSFVQPVHQSQYQINYPSWQKYNFIYRRHANYSTFMVTGCITLQSTVPFLFRLQIYVCIFLYFLNSKCEKLGPLQLQKDTD